jgi:AraC-like DNA-binding protein
MAIYIKDALFFQTNYTKRKSVFVNGRDFYSLTYRHSGKISISSDENMLISEEDCITFIPKNVPYTTEVLLDGNMSVAHFDFDGEGAPNTPIVIPAQHTVFRILFKALTSKNEKDTDDFSRMSVFYEILAELNKWNVEKRQKSVPEKIITAKKMLESNYSDPYFSVELLAERLQISNSYLRREFHTAYGIAPIKHLKELRLEAAKQLLLTDTAPVVDIARQCGYTSVCYFIRDFHKFVGESPNRYRQRLRF